MNSAAFNNDTPEDDYESDLGKAIAIWRSGRFISLTLAARLMAEGYDIGALEQRHLNSK